MTVHQAHRYRGVLGGAVLLAAVGAVLTSDWLIALAAVPLAFVAAEHLTAAPAADLALERRCSPVRPEPGQRVTVRLSVTNDGDAALPDVRVRDGVPAGLTVVDGEPSVATALAAGASETVTYAVRAECGDHAFSAPQLHLRGVVGGTVRSSEPSVEGDESVFVHRFVEEAPSAEEAATVVGVVPADTGGSGVEFHTTREYRPGDPITRIDWRRLARSGELSTVNYRESDGASVTVLADCRPAGATGTAPGSDLPPDVRRTVLDRTGYAADRTVHALARTGHEVGVGALGPERVPWVQPGTSEATERARAALRAVEGEGDWAGPELPLEEGPVPDGTPAEGTGSDGAAMAAAVDGGTVADAGGTGTESATSAQGGDRHADEPGRAEGLAVRVADRLPADGVVVLVSPLLDDAPLDLVGALEARGHHTTVVAPGLGDAEGFDVDVDALARRTRLERLRAGGTHVIDWSETETLPAAIARAEVRRG